MKLSKGLKITALVIMALAAAFFTFMGVGEMLGGDLSGMGHLPPVALILLLMWFGWKKPVTGGITMFLLGMLIGAYFLSLTRSTEIQMAGVLIMSVPFILPGLLFLAAGMVGRSTQEEEVAPDDRRTLP